MFLFSCSFFLILCLNFLWCRASMKLFKEKEILRTEFWSTSVPLAHFEEVFSVIDDFIGCKWRGLA